MKKIVLCIAAFSLSCTFAVAQQQKVLWSFGNVPNDGIVPVGSLIFDRAGNLYGTTEGGGAFGQGAVFELMPKPDGTWSETILYSFCLSYKARKLASCLIFPATFTELHTTEEIRRRAGVAVVWFMNCPGRQFRVAPGPKQCSITFAPTQLIGSVWTDLLLTAN